MRGLLHFLLILIFCWFRIEWKKTNCVTIVQTKQPWTRQQENLQNDDHNNVEIRQISFQLLEKEQEEWHVSALNYSLLNIRITKLEKTQSILVFFFIVSERYHYQKRDQLWNDRVTLLKIRQLRNFLWNCCLAKPSHLSWMEEPIWHLRSWTPSEFPERDAENVLTIKTMKGDCWDVWQCFVRQFKTDYVRLIVGLVFEKINFFLVTDKLMKLNFFL
jgi:hypothetical protein